MRIQFHHGARRDLIDGFHWYEKHSHQAAQKFVEQISSTLDSILKHPTRYRPWKKESLVRVIHLDRYPYQLYYVVSGELITIVATAHDKRRPGYWLRRIT
jgi:toxin ParE1/3/4